MSSALTTEEVLALREAAVDLVTAGRAFGIGRNSAYERAAAGDFPCRVFKIGTLWRVPRADLLRALGLAPPQSSEAGDPAPAVATTQPASSRPEDVEVPT